MNHIFLMKLNGGGGLIWVGSAGSTGSDSSYDVTLDGSDNVYVTGYFEGTVDFDGTSGVFELTAAGDSDVFASKLTGDGALVWAVAMGGTDFESGYGIAADSAGAAHVGGYFLGTVDFDPGEGTFELTAGASGSGFIVKLDSGSTGVVPPDIAPIPDGITPEAAPYTGPAPVLSQGAPAITWSLESGPIGATIDIGTGVVSWPNTVYSASPYTITIRATNSAGFDEESWDLTVTAEPPVITILGDNPAFAGTCVAYVDAGATAFDSVDGDITANIVTNSNVDDSVPGEYMVTYDVTDSGGNPAIQAVRTVFVVASDSDDDGLDDCMEAILGTNPNVADTDGDGIPDGTEVDAGTDPLDDQSFVSDVYADAQEGSDDSGFGTQDHPWATIAHAVSLVEGNAANTISIHVGMGVYTELNVNGGALVLESYEHLLGGYDPAGWVRDTKAYPSVLDASVASAGGPADNVVIADSVVDVLLDGFTVTGADSTGNANPEGAGILATSLDATSAFVDCLIAGNAANFNGSGGILLYNASPDIDGCTIAANTATTMGGGMYLSGNSAPAISGCNISGNAAEHGGGIYVEFMSSLYVTNSIISGNLSPSGVGGGVYFSGDIALLSNCTIAHNVSEAFAGGGLYLQTNNALIANCIFANNMGTAISAVMGHPGPLLENCLFDSNTDADFAAYNSGIPITLIGAGAINSTLANATGDVDGDPLFAMSPEAAWTAAPVYNPATNRTTLADAAASFTPVALRGALIALSADATMQALILDNTDASVEILGDYVAIVVNGDPYHIVDYHLELESAAIDMGRDTSAPVDGAIIDDFDGTARGFDGDGNGAATADGSDYDIGAFESTDEVPAAITVLSPNGGETLYRGAAESISWSIEGSVGANVKILARKGTGSAVLASSTLNDGSFEWTVPISFPLGNNFLIEISSVDSPAILDQSDAFFTIATAPPAGGTVTVVSPNGGESILRGAVFPITWTSTGDIGANVKIFVRKGGSGATVASSTPNDGSFDWTVPAYPPGSGYTIEISSVSAPGTIDTSDAAFSLTDTPPSGPAITVTAPNGGETLIRGAVAPITWTSTGDVGSTVKIIARKGAQSAVVANSTPNDGAYDWAVPVNYPLGSGFLIEISSVSDPGILDTSDATFTLADTPPASGAITVTSPNGGESYVKGTSTSVTWTSSGAVGSNVKITLRKGGQSAAVAASTPNTGAYNWSIPGNFPNGSDYIIEIASVSAPAITDVSGGTFTLTN